MSNRIITFAITMVVLYEYTSCTDIRFNEKSDSLQNSIQGKEKDNIVDNVAEPDEHHRIVILVPQIVHHPASAKKKKPKYHHKAIPVIHSGKVIHAHHHHHAKMDHAHAHAGKAKHDHKHLGNAGHKHSHHGTGSFTHKHAGKAAHSHKHAGDAAHKHAHQGKGIIHHSFPEHKSKKYAHDFYSSPLAALAPLAAPPPASSSRYLIQPRENAFQQHTGFDSNVQNPLANIIQIRIPARSESFSKENEVDAPESASLTTNGRTNPFSQPIEENLIIGGGSGIGGFDYFINNDEFNAYDDDDHDNNGNYQLGDGYRLAASAAAAAAAITSNSNENSFVSNGVSGSQGSYALPTIPNGNVIAYSDAYHYQY